MNPVRRFLAAVWILALAAALAAASGIAVAQSYVHPPTQVAFPAAIAGLQFGGIQDYESKQAGLGVSVRYEGRQMRADVFIYTAGLSRIPSNIDDPLLTRLRLQTEDDILSYAKREGFQPRKTEGAKVDVRTPKGVVPVFYDAFEVNWSGALHDSIVWLWPSRNHFFKVRMTRPSGEHDARQVRQFLEEVVALGVE